MVEKKQIIVNDKIFYLRYFEDPVLGDMVDVYDEEEIYLDEVEGSTENEEAINQVIETIKQEFL